MIFSRRKKFALQGVAGGSVGEGKTTAGARNWVRQTICWIRVHDDDADGGLDGLGRILYSNLRSQMPVARCRHHSSGPVLPAGFVRRRVNPQSRPSLREAVETGASVARRAAGVFRIGGIFRAVSKKLWPNFADPRYLLLKHTGGMPVPRRRKHPSLSQVSPSGTELVDIRPGSVLVWIRCLVARASRPCH